MNQPAQIDPSNALCALHRDVSAAKTCSRCGNFMCQGCASKHGTLCPTCLERGDVNEFAACPACGKFLATRVTFSWWGGMLGPRMFTHVKCGGCSTTYNGKTGKSNNAAIGMYFAVTTGIVILIIILRNA
jgi:hypothetical protein